LNERENSAVASEKRRKGKKKALQRAGESQKMQLGSKNDWGSGGKLRPTLQTKGKGRPTGEEGDQMLRGGPESMIERRAIADGMEKKGKV